MRKRGAAVEAEGPNTRPKLSDEEKEDGAEIGSKGFLPPLEAVNSQSSRQLMALLFKTLDQKNVDYVDNVNAFLVGLLHKEDERETKEENGEAAVCAICKESEPNAKILPCGHSASCSVCTQKVIDVGSGKCPFCRKEVSGEEKRKFWDIRELTLCFVAD